MNRTFLAVLAAFTLGATACGGGTSTADRETTPARADRDERREEQRDERRADRADAADTTADADVERADDDTQVTAADQGNGDTDIAITQQIRQAVVADDRLSFGAKNVTIITREGVVTLRGEVSAAESAVLQEIANGVEGVRRLDNQIEVEAN